MIMEFLSIGIFIFDDVFGGGLLEDSNIFIVYDLYLNGWILVFEILRNCIMEGDFGVILDLVLFFIFLKMELGFI